MLPPLLHMWLHPPPTPVYDLFPRGRAGENKEAGAGEREVQTREEEVRTVQIKIEKARKWEGMREGGRRGFL